MIWPGQSAGAARPALPLLLIVVCCQTACVFPVPKKKDPLDRVTGTEGWKKGEQEDADKEWDDWYRGRVARRAAVRELRLQRSRSRVLVEIKKRSAVIDAAGRAPRKKPPRSEGGLRYRPEDDQLFDSQQAGGSDGWRKVPVQGPPTEGGSSQE